MRSDAIAIELGHDRHRTRRLAETTKVGGGQQQAEITSPAELVRLHEARVKVGPFGAILLLEMVDPLGGGVEIPLDLPDVRSRLLELFRLDLAIDLQSAEIPEQRPFLRRQPIRFALERLQPIAGAARERLRPRAIGLLSEKEDGQGKDAAPDECRLTPPAGALRPFSRRLVEIVEIVEPVELASITGKEKAFHR